MKVDWKDRDLIKNAVDQNVCYADVLRFLNIRNVGTNFKTLKKWIAIHGLGTDHFEVGYARVNVHNEQRRKPVDEVLCEGSKVSQQCLRSFVKREQVIPYNCHGCGNDGSWLNKPIVLQLDHVNGISNDNRVTNLRWLCPNCHSQTPTFAGRNNKTVAS